jgi:hypothetical protein
MFSEVSLAFCLGFAREKIERLFKRPRLCGIAAVTRCPRQSNDSQWAFGLRLGYFRGS